MIKSQGFTLIELMIVVAIIAILAVVAISAYHTYTTRIKISEAIIGAGIAKTLVSETFISDGNTHLADMVLEYNASSVTDKQTRYVSDIQIDNNGVITITLTNQSNIGLPNDVLGKTLVMTPNVNGEKLTNTVGNIDWACASASNSNATAKSLVADLGTLPSIYAPSECK